MMSLTKLFLCQIYNLLNYINLIFLHLKITIRMHQKDPYAHQYSAKVKRNCTVIEHVEYIETH